MKLRLRFPPLPRLSGPSIGWMRYYLCFTSSTAIGPLCDREYDRECDWDRLVLNHLRSSTARLWCYSVENPCTTSAKQKRDRGRDSQPRPRPRLCSQRQAVAPLQNEIVPIFFFLSLVSNLLKKAPKFARKFLGPFVAGPRILGNTVVSKIITPEKLFFRIYVGAG